MASKPSTQTVSAQKTAAQRNAGAGMMRSLAVERLTATKVSIGYYSSRLAAEVGRSADAVHKVEAVLGARQRLDRGRSQNLSTNRLAVI